MMIDAENIQKMHQEFYNFWISNRLPNGRVMDESIQPRELKSLLPNIVKIRNTPVGPKYTIIGTQVVEEYRQDYTGFLVSEHPHELCRKTYISMMQKMDTQPSLVNCYGYFCYPDKAYLRTMETGFALSSPDGNVSGYLVLVTVDHTYYSEAMYLPKDPANVIAHEVCIQNQHDFDRTMSLYKTLSA